MVRWFGLPLNPEPWAVGSVSIGKQGGKHVGRISPNPNLAAFQNAVREEMTGVSLLPPEYTRFEFYFWRQQARYLDAADRIRQRNQADATNLQKSLEDALQGILFENDREVTDIRSVIVEQGPQVEPGIVICAMRSHAVTLNIPKGVLEGVHAVRNLRKDNTWGEGSDLF